MPNVAVLYFSGLRLALGRESESFELPENTTVPEILQAIAAAHPSQSEAILGARLAVDQAFASGEVRLHNGSELAVITPVSGG